MKIVAKASDKAGGLDGLSYGLLKRLPEAGFKDLAKVLNQAEAGGRIPQQWARHQVALLPKAEDIERPITLTSITYRLYCFARKARSGEPAVEGHQPPLPLGQAGARRYVSGGWYFSPPERGGRFCQQGACHRAPP